MTPEMSTQERQLCQLFLELPRLNKFRYTPQANRDFIQSLFWSLAGGRREYIDLLFPNGPPPTNEVWSLRDAQGALDGAEYTESARGKACGHIFKAGEAIYSCRTCSTDDTCVLCSRCYDSSEHTGHQIRVNISMGNSGCCDCGDPEAWKIPLFCNIHSELPEGHPSRGKFKERGLPQDLVASIRMTIARAIDYLNDVISCSPEQLRQPKTVQSVHTDERLSRLSDPYVAEASVDDDDDNYSSDPHGDYALVLWNDEKHTMEDVKMQVARACRVSEVEGHAKARETDWVGRSILKYDGDIDVLIKMASILEQIKITVTVRTSRDTFREQMCGAIVEWLTDISGCRVGSDLHVLRTVFCEELLSYWRPGSLATHAVVGEDGIDDESVRENALDNPLMYTITGETIVIRQIRAMRTQRDQVLANLDADDEDENMSDGDGEDGSPSSPEADEDDMAALEDVDQVMWDNNADGTGEVPMADWTNNNDDDSLEADEARIAGFRTPPPPPAARVRRTARDRDVTPSDSDTAEPFIAPTHINKGPDVPKTPGIFHNKNPHPGRYWMGIPAGYINRDDPSSAERFPSVRLDWMILFDLRMWKKVRNDLRALYISTVVTLPEFKRILGIRFAGLYTTLAQLYLVADREPDHSITNISLQMLTTPSITEEIVERGNFLTSLMAILFTFLTTRQVGHPWEVNSNGILAFDSGSVTNRRVYHFFQDLRYMFGSPHVQDRLRTEERYLMQFLDLVKLNQGICPNVRAIGEHVEYEADTWLGASVITREINKLCRQLSDSFKSANDGDPWAVSRAIRLAAKSVIVNSIGAERGRFQQAEIREEVRFKTIEDFEFEPASGSYEVVNFAVEEQPVSFHHALHYTLSWLIECAKFLDAATLRDIMSFTTADLKAEPRSMGKKMWPRRDYLPEDYLMAAFDHALRVCAWLAQVKAGMWVRNGLSLRHQSGTYRNILHRDLGHHRDIFLLQTALVTCNPSRVLASIVDRYGMEKWVKGIFETKTAAQDDVQHLDVVEDMVHLLIVLLSDRTSLLCPADEPNPFVVAMRRDIAHILCFKPLSFSEIHSKIPDRFQESVDLHQVLQEMATFKPPEGVSDVGTFELRPEYVETLDPYNAHYNKNQREESEAAYRKLVAVKTGKSAEDVVYEPTLRSITSGLFKNLAGFTATGMFAQIVYYCLLYPLHASKLTNTVPLTRVETFLHVVLHLVIIAISEDKTEEGAMLDDAPQSFVHIALTRKARGNFMATAPEHKSIVAMLDLISEEEELKACHGKVALILTRMRQKRPLAFGAAYHQLGVSIDRVSTASPAKNNEEEEKERRKKAALDRQARVMAQFHQQQKNFMAQQVDMDWGELDDEMDDDQHEHHEHKKLWKYPDGTCILCQEDTDDKRLYGTFALFINSNILRQTDLQDQDFVREVSNTPCNLDRSAEDIRPFGVAHENRRMVEKINSAGETVLSERQVIGKGFPGQLARQGPVSVGCGHIMHYHCFETYYEATRRRHGAQIARHHPENLKNLEFVCPLCKALGNAFLPIIWKGKEESYPGVLSRASEEPFAEFLDNEIRPSQYSRLPGLAGASDANLRHFEEYTGSAVVNTVADKVSDFNKSAWEDPTSTSHSRPPTVANTPTTTAFDTPGTSQWSGSEQPSGTPGITTELVVAYRRLRDTFKANGLSSYDNISDGTTHPDQLSCYDALARSLGYTISAVEIQQRGVDAEGGITLLDKIPEQVLTQLRVLAETASTYTAIAGLRDGGSNFVGLELLKEAEKQHCQLFACKYLDSDTNWSFRPSDKYQRPLLELDPFVFLCETLFGLATARDISLPHLMRICYLAEITKVVYHMSFNIDENVFMAQLSNTLMEADGGDPKMRVFAQFVMHIVKAREGIEPDVPGKGSGFQQPGLDNIMGYYSFVKKYALVFLRKSAILCHVYGGVDLGGHVPMNPEADELERLTEALHLPSFDDMCASILSPSTPSPEEPMDEGLTAEGEGEGVGRPNLSSPKILVNGWIQHHTVSREVVGDRLPRSAMLSHPAIFELVGLPRDYGTLIEETTKGRCPTTGKDISDAAICLFCGDIFCTQSVCCLREEGEGGGGIVGTGRGGGEGRKIGGAQQHMRRCQGNVGLFLNIRKCCILYLHRTSGSWSNAPYMDKYGEVDVHLRHGRLLSLSQKRYDAMLRSMWLGHGIPTFISRKLEGDTNNGGWETI